MEEITIAIDGSPSYGKGIMARDLAHEVGYIYIDDGAVYRVVTLYNIESGISNRDVVDTGKLKEAIRDTRITFRPNPETGRPDTYLNGVNVENKIRMMEASSKVSPISTLDSVRGAMIIQQQAMDKEKGIMMDGQDIGTIVFPDAELKIPVTATLETRTQRRFDELEAKGQEDSFEEILENVKQRNYIGQHREVNLLRKADDALLLDNSNLSIEQQKEWLSEQFGKVVKEQRMEIEYVIEVEIDEGSGFCFGMVTAIHKMEEELAKGETLYCLGGTVHNSREVERLKAMGLITINRDEFRQLHNAKMLFRVHGEPPETYQIAHKNNIEIIDTACPAVLRLRKHIKQGFRKEDLKEKQIVIHGKNGHAEVLGLVRQTGDRVVIIESAEKAKKLDFTRSTRLFSQTTRSLDESREIVEYIKLRVSPDVAFEYYDTTCRQVANHMPNLREFVATHDLIFFVNGRKSSDREMLFEECLEANASSHLIDDEKKIDLILLRNVESIGVCGVTSIPEWLMEKIHDHIQLLIKD